MRPTASIRNRLAAGLCAAALLAGAQAAQPTADATSFSFLNYTAPVPPGWQPQAPGSSFRAAQFRVPAAAGASDGEAIVFYFGQGQGGSAAANTARWVSQFSGADGGAVPPKVETLKVNGMAATLTELSGSYARGVGGAVSAPKPNQTLLAAVIESPDGNVIFQLHGDKATVEQHRAAFLAMVRGFKAL